MQCLELSLHEPLAAEPFRLSYPLQPDVYADLADKLPDLPLVVIDRQRRIVFGLDYCQLVQQRGVERVAALQVEHDDARNLCLAYTLKHTLTGLNAYEKLIFLHKITPLAAPRDIYRWTPCDLALNDELMRVLPRLLAPPFDEPLMANAVTVKAAVRLAQWRIDDARAVLGMFGRCHFSDSQQWKILDLAEEICFREKISAAELLEHPALAAEFAGEMPQKKVIAALSRRRFPAYSLAEDDFHALVKGFHLPAGAQVAHDPYFEKDNFVVSIPVQDRAALVALLKKIAESK